MENKKAKVRLIAPGHKEPEPEFEEHPVPNFGLLRLEDESEIHTKIISIESVADDESPKSLEEPAQTVEVTVEAVGLFMFSTCLCVYCCLAQGS